MHIKDLILFSLSTATLAAVVFLVLRYFRLRHRHMVHLERMAAIDKGVFEPTSGDDEMTENPSTDAQRIDSFTWFRITSLGFGLLFLFGGVGVLAGLASVDNDELQSLSTLGLIPIMAGFGLLLFSLVSSRLKQ